MGEHLYEHSFQTGKNGLEAIVIKITDRAGVNDPTRRKGFWAYKLDSFVPKGLNIRDSL